MTTTPDFQRICTLLEPGTTLTSAQQQSLYTWAQAAAQVVDLRIPSASCMTAAIRQMVAEHLAAHYYELGAGRDVTSERLLDYAVSYASGNDAGLRSTRNGRIALELDCTGTLATASRPRPQFAVLDQNSTSLS